MGTQQPHEAASHPGVDDARQLAKRHKLARCVVLFQMENGQVGYASYGKDRALCRSTREIMDGVFGELEYRMFLEWRRLKK